VPVSPVILLTGTTPARIAVVKPLTRMKLKKVMAYNGDTASHRIQLGYASVDSEGNIAVDTFVQILPDIVVPAGQTIVVDKLPEAEVASTRTVFRALVARLEGAAAAPVAVVVEWEEA